ncbi:uncharacterized protein LOC121373407 [Gigantopelta aegis]|uniref:uncharacterized protein LOC121373407 n=1 Tax=Gigantopelta aegis TaxID=1735272 RepID=UPI001B889A1E|nr:uncharacterized protein LOC121373407 [Gigantopelta aegis]
MQSQRSPGAHALEPVADSDGASLPCVPTGQAGMPCVPTGQAGMPCVPTGQAGMPFVTGNQNVHVGDVTHKHYHKTGDDRSSKMIDTTSQQLQNLETDAYVKTRAFEAAKKRLLDLGIVVLIGSSGSGKSSLGLNLLKCIGDLDKRQPMQLTHHTQFEDIPVPKDMARIKAKDTLVVMIDDMFGRSNLVTDFQRSWELKFQKMWDLTDSGLVKFIITFRTHIFYDCRNNLKEFPVFKKCHQVDLHGPDYCLTIDEKRNILNTHLSQKQMTMKEEDKEMAVSETFTALGFPQCCNFYVKNPEARKRGVRYFKKPIEYLTEEFEKMRSDQGEENQLQYLVLLLVMFKQGTLKKNDLWQSFEEDVETTNLIKKLKDVACSIKGEVTRRQIKQTVDSLCGVYLSYSDECKEYSFIHQSVFDTLFLQFSSEYFKESIMVCPVSMLVEYVVTSEALTDGAVTLVVESDKYAVLAQRFTDLLMSDKARDVLLHPSFKDEHFVEFLTSEFWNSLVLSNILSINLVEQYEKIVKFIEESLLNRCWDVADKVNLHYLNFRLDSAVSIIMLTSSTTASVAVVNNLQLVSKYFAAKLVEFHSTIPAPHLQEALSAAVLMGNTEVADILLQCTEPTIDSFIAAAGSKTDNVAIFEELLKHNKQLTLPVDYLGQLLFLAMEVGNGKICSLLIDKIGGMERSDEILDQAVKRLLLGIHDHTFQNVLANGAVAHLFRQLSRYSKVCTSDTAIVLAAGCSHAVILKEIIDLKPNVLNGMTHVESLLHNVAKSGCLESLLIFINQGCDVNSVNATGKTPLHIAAQFGKLELVKALVKHGAELNAVDYSLNIPLHFAILFDSFLNLSCVLETYAKIPTKAGIPPVFALQYKAVEHLQEIVRKCAEGNQRNRSVNNPDQMAAFGIINVLLKIESQRNVRNRNGNTPFEFAIPWRLSFLSYGVAECSFKVTGAGKGPLYFTEKNASLEIVRYLVGKGAHVNQRNATGNTPLHFASLWPLDYLYQEREDVKVKSQHRDVSLRSVARCRSSEVVSCLVQGDAQVNVQNERGNTPLHSAALYSFAKIITFLIEKKAQANLVDKNGLTPLHFAAYGRSSEIINDLIGGGADVNVKDKDGNSPLHIAAHFTSVENVGCLVQRRAQIDMKNEDGNTPLHLAAKQMSLNIVSYLVEKGALVNLQNQNGETPLFFAAEQKCLEIVSYLIGHGAQVNIQNQNGKTPLHFSAERYLVKKEAQLDHPTTCETTETILVEKHGSMKITRCLVEKGADVNVQTENGNTPLHLTAKQMFLEGVSYLIAKGAKVNAQNEDGETPLHIAVQQMFWEGVCDLVEKGSQVDIQDKNGQTPLHIAAENTPLQIMRYLVEKGSYINCEDRQGYTPLGHACLSGETENVQFLLDECADPNYGNIPAMHVAAGLHNTDMLQVLLDEGGDINSLSNSGSTPLHIAVRWDLQTVLSVSTYNSYFNYRTEYDLLFCENYCDILSESDSFKSFIVNFGEESETEEDLLNFLLQNGCDLNVRNSSGQTALHVCVLWDQLGNLKNLLQRGADVSVVDDGGNSVLHYAVGRQQVEAVEMLVESGAVDMKNNDGLSASDLAFSQVQLMDDEDRMTKCCQIISHLS